MSKSNCPSFDLYNEHVKGDKSDHVLVNGCYWLKLSDDLRDYNNAYPHYIHYATCSPHTENVQAIYVPETKMLYLRESSGWGTISTTQISCTWEEAGQIAHKVVSIFK